MRNKLWLWYAVVVGNGPVDDPDGDDTVQHSVPGTVDCSLATSGYPLEDFVSADSLEHRCAGDYIASQQGGRTGWGPI